jgi:homotetrameric cytidine deaminase
MKDPAGTLLNLTTDYVTRARCPYSGNPASAVALLSDGSWVPGVRIESASFSLAIDEAVNAVSTAVAAGRTDIVSVALSHGSTEAQSAYLAGLGLCSLRRRSDRLFVTAGTDSLPPLSAELDPRTPMPESESAGIEVVRATSERAYIPESFFPVGCIAVADNGTAVPGVNVEHPDWNRIICAERNALGTAVTYRLGAIRTLYLSCPQDPAGSPCGACRQVLAELAPNSTIVMDRNRAPSHVATPGQLLPGSFTGNALLRTRTHRPAGS